MKTILRNLLRSSAAQAIAISLLAEALKSAVKNPSSESAKDLRAGVSLLRDTCEVFLESVPEK